MIRKVLLILAIVIALIPSVYYAGIRIYAAIPPEGYDTPRPNSPNPAKSSWGELPWQEQIVYKDPRLAGILWPTFIIMCQMSYPIAVLLLATYFGLRLRASRSKQIHTVQP